MNVEANNKKIADLAGITVEELKIQLEDNKHKKENYDAELKKGFEALTNEDKKRITKELVELEELESKDDNNFKRP